MATRSVRLDKEAETALSGILRCEGLSISAAIKRGLLIYREKTLATSARKPADFFKQFDLGEGGYSIGPARNAKALIKDKLHNKRGKKHDSAGYRPVRRPV